MLLAYAVVAREVFHFERTHLTAVLCVAWAVALDLAIGVFVFRRPRFPLTPVIIGLACGLLMNAQTPFPYLAAVTLAILSKAAITYHGRHLFNPANFGVTLVLLLLPSYATGMPSLFGGYIVPSLVFAALGLLTVVYARQLEVSLSWIAGFLALALVRARIADAPPILALAPALGPAFLLFSFHMISDPATTPRSRGLRIAFGLAVASVDAVLRFFQIPNSSFYALFGVCAFNPWLLSTSSSQSTRTISGSRTGPGENPLGTKVLPVSPE